MKLFWAAVCLCLVFIADIATAAPSTQPATAVVVTPFKSIADPQSQISLGRAIQQNLMADLARAKFHPIQENDLSADPQSAGHNAGAAYVITGNWQTADDSLRFTGQIIDVKTGNIIGGLSATGSSRDLFALEDTLSDQAIHQLHQLTAPPSVHPAIAAAPPTVLELLAVEYPPMRPYQGSDLQSYVDSNRTPSNDYWEQYRISKDRQTYGFDYANSYYPYSSFGYGIPFFSGFSFGYSFLGASSFPGRHLPLR